MKRRSAMAIALLVALIAVSTRLSRAQDDPSSEATDAGPFFGSSAANASNLTIAAQFFEAANLTGVSNATLFAPTDAAFQQLAALLNVTNTSSLLEPPLANTSLEIVKLHVVPGFVLRSTDIPCEANTTLPTLSDNYTINVFCGGAGGATQNQTIYVKGPANPEAAEVIQPDIPFGNNSILHVINAVLLV